ncbi:lantibiotic dehydratase [Dyadobacter beijingensis]|uniref:lantibiotic dehydratase n=1 Tax=Dyadobacter beijingensis TaxID=365489 RepID=UPI00166901E5|nr:lantibiotic dehydratase [Dyadobacter beijingensis]
MQDAIRLASPDLHTSLLCWLQNMPLKGREELIATFYKYFVRASTRCTPFGLFAGLAYGEILRETKFAFNPELRPVMQISPEFDWQCRLSKKLFRDPDVRAKLLVKPNSSLVNGGGSHRYIERTEGGYFLNTFTQDEPLRLTLELVGEGIRYETLTNQLVQMGYELDKVISFIDELLENDLLEFAENPTVIGRMFPGKVIDRLGDGESIPESVRSLHSIQSLFDNPTSDLELLEILRDKMTQIDSPSAGIVRLKVDSFFTFEKAQLSETFVQSTIDSLRDLSVLNFNAPRQDLESFKEKFRFKYDTQEIPLWLALDSELGLGFEGDFGSLDTADEGQVLQHRDLFTNTTEAPGAWWQNYLASKYLSVLASRTREISLVAADLRAIKDIRPKEHTTSSMASSAFAFGSIIADTCDVEASGNLQFILAVCQGPSAINMLGRFAGGCERLRDQLSNIVAYEQEQNPDALLAEVVHAPGGKVANIMSRPTLYDYEIEYLGNASVEKENVIVFSDLMVSVHEGQIMLRCKKRDKRVIPRLSNMHNHQRGLPVYRFLAALQSQDSSFRINWDWGFLAHSDFLPRITYKHIIVARATWKLKRPDFQSLTITEIAAKLASLDVPNQFVIAEGDNELFVDASVRESLLTLRSYLLKHEVVYLKEFIHKCNNALIRSGDEIVVNEMVIPFQIQQSGNRHKRLATLVPNRPTVTEQFEPGSEWIYVKLYASEAMTDSLIRNKIANFAAELVERGVVEKFFFIRYHDVESHLRMRFLRLGNSTLEDIIAPLRQLLAFEFTHKLIARMQLDTYQRELDRYGRDKIEDCETYFSEDSLAISKFLAEGNSIRTIQERLTYAVVRIMEKFTSAGILSNEMSGICLVARNRLLLDLALPLAELSNWRGLTSALARQAIDCDEQDSPDSCSRNTLRTILQEMEGSKRENLIIDLIHMSINRLFKDHQRYYEAVVYHFIYKINLAKVKRSLPAVCVA